MNLKTQQGQDYQLQTGAAGEVMQKASQIAP
jgi:hypothetical protein